MEGDLTPRCSEISLKLGACPCSEIYCRRYSRHCFCTGARVLNLIPEVELPEEDLFAAMLFYKYLVLLFVLCQAMLAPYWKVSSL